MIARFNVSGDRLIAVPQGGLASGRLPEADPETPSQTADAQTVWIDLRDPTIEEERRLEASLAIDLPTREDMDEIELSSRLYAEAGALFMTAIVPSQSESDAPVMAPVTFVLAGQRLITIRYHNPRAFDLFVSRAAKGGLQGATGEEVMLSLLEMIIDRLADVLERVGRDVDVISRKTFAHGPSTSRPRQSEKLRATLGEIGRKGDMISNIRDSLGTLDRLAVFFGQRLRSEAATADTRERVKDLTSDIKSLSDHSTFTAQKVTFLLDATLGLINIEQNRILQIFSVMSVVFLPPTLVASTYGMNFDVMPELHFTWGYPAALVLIVASAVGPYLFFRRKGWL
jgi:magnesium transporter